MWDVGRAAGVSQATVSLVLNDAKKSRVSPETRQRVRHAIKALGYRTNATAKALRERNAELVGFIGDEVASTPFSGEVIEGAQERAWQDGYLLMVVNTGGKAELEEAAVQQMQAHQVRRFIYASMCNRLVRLPEALEGFDVVILNAADSDGRTRCVAPDEVRGGREATEHLIAVGHRRIGFINVETLESGLPAATGRHEGFRQAIEQAGLDFDPQLVRFGGGGPMEGYDHAAALMDLREPPTAIFCGNDRTAWGAYQALQERGLSIPGDVSIIGFDNQDTLAPFLRPALTTMNLPFREMGSVAVDLLLSGGGDGDSTQTLLHCGLVQRDSVKSFEEMS